MNEITDIALAARRLIDMGESGLLATLFGVEGSSYRLPGSMMLVTPANVRIGGISGGCLEDYVAREGRRLTQLGDAALLAFDTAIDSEDSGVPTPGCGGRLEVLVEQLTAHHAELLEAIVAARMTGEVSVLVHVLDDSRESVNGVSIDRALLQGDRSLWNPALLATEDDLVRRCELVERDRTSFQGAMRFHGRRRRVLLQPIEPVLRLMIFGTGDDACALLRQANLLGWHVTICDRRARLATATRFPTASRVMADDWARMLPALDVRPNTAAVVMTHSLSDDAAVLAHLARHQLNYVGLLGPASRRESVVSEAATIGGEPLPNAFVEAIRGPAGLDLGLKSPEAIALSLAAEIVAATHGREGGSLSKPLADDASLQASS